MYDLKTLLPQFEIQLPTRMYALKNVGLAPDMNTNTAPAMSNGNGNDLVPPVEEHTDYNQLGTSNVIGKQTRVTQMIVDSVNAASPASSFLAEDCCLDLDDLDSKIQNILKLSLSAEQLREIVNRQEKLFKDLNGLSLRLGKVRPKLGLCGKNIKHTQHTDNGGLYEETPHDIVINGHPKFIPYALLAIKNAWKDLYTLDITFSTHSTMPDIGDEARAFEQRVKEVPVNTSKPSVKLTLIWKNCEHTEMISACTRYMPIFGEVNIIRYLGRIGPQEYRYENSRFCNEIDSVLDMCYKLLRCKEAKARAAVIRALNNILQKQQYFAGDKISIADIGVHSSLLRMSSSISDKDLTPTLCAWRKRAQLITKL